MKKKSFRMFRFNFNFKEVLKSVFEEFSEKESIYENDQQRERTQNITQYTNAPFGAKNHGLGKF